MNPISDVDALTPSESLLSGFTLEDLQLLVNENPSLRGYIQGYLGELMLRRLLLHHGLEVTKIKDHSVDKGDFLVQGLDAPVTIEVKSLSSGSRRQLPLDESWEARVLCKNTDKRVHDVPGLGEVHSCHVPKGVFDILAICTYPITGTWDFLFIESRFLPEAEGLPGLIKTTFMIDSKATPGLYSTPLPVIESVRARKLAAAA